MNEWMKCIGMVDVKQWPKANGRTTNENDFVTQNMVCCLLIDLWPPPFAPMLIQMTRKKLSKREIKWNRRQVMDKRRQCHWLKHLQIQIFLSFHFSTFLISLKFRRYYYFWFFFPFFSFLFHLLFLSDSLWKCMKMNGQIWKKRKSD